MTTVRFHSHGRLQEWVAEENDYFAAEGLSYEFVGSHKPSTRDLDPNESVCDVAFQSFWTVHLKRYSPIAHQWGHAYWVAPSGIWVPPESPIKRAEDLADVEIALGYLAGTHFAVIQALEGIVPEGHIKLAAVGDPSDRFPLALERKVPAVNLYGVPAYVAEQLGFRKVLDTTFMIGFSFHGAIEREDVARYLRALARAQEDIDQHPEQYKHFLLRDLPQEFHSKIDLRAAGPGERLVFQEYTRESFDRTRAWMVNLDVGKQEGLGDRDYESIFF